jgi:hypothetical protein
MLSPATMTRWEIDSRVSFIMASMICSRAAVEAGWVIFTALCDLSGGPSLKRIREPVNAKSDETASSRLMSYRPHMKSIA